MPRLLITGFEPFGGRDLNPSELIATALDGISIRSVEVIGRVLPVSFARLPALLDALLEAERPDAVLSIGMAAGAERIRLEQLAVNAMHTQVPDNDGVAPFSETISDAGPLARRATIDLAPVVRHLIQDWQPVELSFHAGTHCCNLTLYHLLGRLAKNPIPCAFIHVPCLPEQTDRAPDLGEASMPLDQMIETVRNIASHVMLRASTRL